MLGRTPTAPRDLFDSGSLLSRFQHGVSRMHRMVRKTASPNSLPNASCPYQSMFVRPCSRSRDQIQMKEDEPARQATLKSLQDRSDLVVTVTGLEDVSVLVASFLDGRSIGRMMLVNKSWHASVNVHEEKLFKSLLQCEFDTTITSSTALKSYLFSLRNELDRELAHCRYIQHAHAALEHYCTEIEPDNHGFVAMFCDIVRFRDPRIARFVAEQRTGALNMVLTATPKHVQAFRQACPDAGPIAFVPFDNPHWPQFDLPRVDFPGFLGYAFDHVEVVEGYEDLKDTVIKSILKELMLFDTAENAAAYGRAIGRPPFVAIVGGTEEAPPYHLTFSNPLREELRHLSVNERIDVLSRRIAAVDISIWRRSSRVSK